MLVCRAPVSLQLVPFLLFFPSLLILSPSKRTKMSKRMINPSTGRGRVALVTGSASSVGIGAAMCRVFAREGAKVVVSDLPSREKDGLERVKELNDAYGDVRGSSSPVFASLRSFLTRAG